MLPMSAYGSKKRTWSPLELEWQAVVSHLTGVLRIEQCVLFTAEPALRPKTLLLDHGLGHSLPAPDRTSQRGGQCVKMPDAKQGDVGSVFGARMVEAENRLTRLISTCVACRHVYTYTHLYVHTK